MGIFNRIFGSGQPEPEDTTANTSTAGQAADGQAVGQAADGPVADGPVADGQAADGQAVGQAADGPVADGPVADGQAADGQAVGQAADGPVADGQAAEQGVAGQAADGPVADGQAAGQATSVEPVGDAEPTGPDTRDALTAAYDAAHPGEETPEHFATIISYRLGGPDPLDGVSVYRASEPVPHWHYVSYGFSDLPATAPENGGDPKEVKSGYGFEMTFRLADPQSQVSDSNPPQWPVSLMQNLARYVFSTGNVFQPGHHLSTNGPIALEEQTDLEALVFAEDPQLPPIVTPSGTVQFVQAVGVTLDELEAAQAWNALGVAELLEQRFAMLVTDLTRGSIMSDPAAQEAVRTGIEREGSSQGVVYVPRVRITAGETGVLAEVESRGVAMVLSALPGRLPFGKPFSVVDGEGDQIVFIPDEQDSIKVDHEGDLLVGLSPETLQALLAHLRPEPGDYQVPGIEAITFRVTAEE